jgi:predicted ArsR family transcriptional regulator
VPFRINRFETSLSDNTDEDVLNKLKPDMKLFDDLTTPNQTATWIKNMVDKLTDITGETVARRVLEDCGRQCIGQSILVKARRIKEDARDLDDLLFKLNNAHIGGGKLHREDQIIHASYERCYCGSVNKTRHPISTVYCQCSCGWYRTLFETLLDKPVRVELIDSIINGADACSFVIYL